MPNGKPDARRSVVINGRPLLICDVPRAVECLRTFRTLKTTQRYPYVNGNTEPLGSLVRGILKRPESYSREFLAAFLHFVSGVDRAAASETVMRHLARIINEDDDPFMYFDPAIVANASLGEIRGFFVNSVGIGRQRDMAYFWWHNCRRVVEHFGGNFANIFSRCASAPRALHRVTSAPKNVKVRTQASRQRRQEIFRTIQDHRSLFADEDDKESRRSRQLRINALYREHDDLLVQESDALMDWFMGFGPWEESKTGRLLVLRHHRYVQPFRGIRQLGMPVDFHVVRLAVALGIIKQYHPSTDEYVPLYEPFYKVAVIPVLTQGLTEACQKAGANSHSQELWWLYGNRVCSNAKRCLVCGFRKMGMCSRTISSAAYYHRGVIEPVALPASVDGVVQLSLGDGFGLTDEAFYAKGGAILGEYTPIGEEGEST